MLKFIVPTIGVGAIAATAILGCSKSSDGSGPSSSTNSSVSGKLSSVSLLSKSSDMRTMVAKTITHVMAVSPSSNPERFVAAVAGDGSFSLGLNAGKPYIIVFVAQDGTLTGPDMIAGIVRVSANQLDTLPIAQQGNIALGEVDVDGSTQEATPSTTVNDLLSSLGVTSAEASYIGSVDDLALRLANPDIDMNGVIDANEDKRFGFDWHVRANTQLDGQRMTLSDVENKFADETGSVSLEWRDASAMAVYKRSFDDVDYVSNGSLANGGNFTSTDNSATPNGYSGGTFSEMRQWGPGYSMANTDQLPASGGSAATFTYTLGNGGKQLKFSNVRTKTKTQLNQNGLILPFIKVNTSGNKITGIGYKWMKRTNSSWEQASTTEVSLVVQSTGAYLMLYTVKNGSDQKGLSFKIPSSSASGTINIGGSGFENREVTDPSNVGLSNVCNVALSYDDEIGLRIFAGDPAPTVSPCN